MDQPLYDIISTGQLVEGTDPEQALQNLARLFKTTPDKISRFIDGNAHSLKRGVDKATALQYKAALHKAGIVVAFKAHQEITEEPAPSPQPKTSSAPAAASPESTEAITLAPAGTEVLRDNERQGFIQRDIDTSNIQLSSPFQEGQEISSAAVAAAPDTSRFSIAETGADLNPDRPAPPPELEFNLDEITIAAPGSLLEQLGDEKPALKPDTSALSIVPPGADLLEETKPAPPPAPDTSHLSLKGTADN
jgi:hypothetical protein